MDVNRTRKYLCDDLDPLLASQGDRLQSAELEYPVKAAKNLQLRVEPGATEENKISEKTEERREKT